MELHTVRGVLDAIPPFDFDKSLSFVCSFPPTRDEQRVAERSLTKAILVRGEPVLFELASKRDARLAYALHARTPIDARTRDEALARIRFHLSLDDDLAPFYARADEDSAFGPIARGLRGMHHVKFASVTEIAVWAILAQRTPMAVARRRKDALVARFGAAIAKDGAEYRAFPDARTLADASAEIGAVVRDARRAEAIGRVARALEERGEAWLRSAPYDDVDRWLRDLPRIGEWSSAFILFRGLGRMERMSSRGGPIYEAARRVYGPATDSELARISDSYGSWRGYWSLYLRVAA